jgi:hypothetical protein
MLVPTSSWNSATLLRTVRTAIAQKDGAFEVAGVKPDTYHLISLSEDLSSGLPMASQDIQVGGEHVSGVALGVPKDGKVTSSVTVDGHAPASFKALAGHKPKMERRGSIYFQQLEAAFEGA